MPTLRINAALVAAVVLIAAACGSSVTVEVTTESADGPQQQANLPLQFLPFDRDSAFDALDTQASTPAPTMSAELQSASERVAAMQTDWREKETAWGEARDELRTVREALDRIDSRDPDYRRQYDRFNELEGVERRLDRERKTAFDAFTAAQGTVTARVDSFRVVRENWAEEAYAGYYDIEVQLLGGAKVIEDTTNAQGMATLRLPGGDWWVTARAPVAAGEMYWNMKMPGADTVRLDQTNGELRARL
jgi:hypothetical protein